MNLQYVFGEKLLKDVQNETTWKREELMIEVSSKNFFQRNMKEYNNFNKMKIYC